MAPTAENEKQLIESLKTGLFIDGTWRDASSGETFEVEDPATGRLLTTVADATPEDGMAALAAATEAQKSWGASAPRERAEILRRAFEVVTARADDFALLMTMEMGKPLAEAHGEVTYGAEFLRWFSEEAVRISGRWSLSPDGKTRFMTMRQPVGPTLMITPWNFPLAMGTRKIGPAIAAGCTMVVKPAHETPLTMLALAALLEEVGLPRGVLNVVTTTDSGGVCEPLIRDSRLRKLTFTGSTAVGKVLVGQASDQLLRVSMELGGNAPFLVFPDADLDAAVDGAMLAKMRNAGEACTSPVGQCQASSLAVSGASPHSPKDTRLASMSAQTAEPVCSTNRRVRRHRSAVPGDQHLISARFQRLTRGPQHDVLVIDDQNRAPAAVLRPDGRFRGRDLGTALRYGQQDAELAAGAGHPDEEAARCVSGDGYAGEGEVSLASAPIDPLGHPVLQLLGRTAALCNDAHLVREPDGTFVVRDYLTGETKYLEHSEEDLLIHDLENVGDTRLRFVTVELLD